MVNALENKVIDGNTKVYGIIGNPVRHSRSPIMHNAGFTSLGINAVYLPFPVEDVGSAVIGIRALGILGISVTIPHKENIITYLDSVDPVAAKIGAVNTVQCIETESGRKLHGANTDWIGANRALEEKIALSGKRAVILGAGGSARSIGFGLLEAGVDIILCSRTEKRGKSLADVLACPWFPLSALSNLEGDILINATSVGMTPLLNHTLVNQEDLVQYKVVMDIVYSPVRTRLIQEAESKGCLVISGLEMLLYQGIAQFEIWTGQKVPVAIMRKALLAGVEIE